MAITLRHPDGDLDPTSDPDGWLEWHGHDGDAEITVWEATDAVSAGTPPGWVVDRRAARVRLGVLDGGDVVAARVAHDTLLGDEEAAVCLWRANGALRGEQPPREAAAVVADLALEPGGGVIVEVARAADCAAYARVGEEWRALFPVEVLVDEVRAIWEAWLAAHPDASPVEEAAAEQRALGAPSVWRSAPVGRFPEPVLETAVVYGCDELVLATGAARLDLTSPGRVEPWMARVRGGARPPARRPRRGHTAVVRWIRGGAKPSV